MGSCQTKDDKSSSGRGGGRSGCERVAVVGLKNKVMLLQQEINEIMCIRETENQVYERELMAFAFKQAQWKREKKTLKDEVKKLCNILADKEDRLTNITSSINNNTNNSYKRSVCHISCINNNNNLEEEQTMIRRDETVEYKWKQLYFAIKDELDHLIQRTHQEERQMCWNIDDHEEEEVLLVKMKNELLAKEERIELLETKLASMEDQESKREREIDILRQSLRIMSYNRRPKI